MRRWKILGALLAGSLALPLAGCLSGLGTFEGPMDYLMFFIGGATRTSKAKVKTPFEGTMTLVMDATYGGLDGTYDVTLSRKDGPTFGDFMGTGKVKRGRFVTIKDKDSAGLIAAVDAMVEDIAKTPVTITKAKAKIKASQEPGGVALDWKGSIKFKGTVDGGPQAGAKIKKGKFSIEGHHDND
jgi:hypothetical protein